MIENFENKNIQEFEYSKTINSDGNIIGTCELGKAEIQILNNTNQYNNLKNQWIKTIHGSFYIHDIEPVQEKVSIKLKCYDIKYKFDIKYNSSLYTWPMTLKEWRNKIFENCNVLYDDTDFPNSDLILSKEPHIGEAPSNREVIKLIAQAGCSFVDNDNNDIIYFKWFSENTYKVNDWIELTTETQNTAEINVVTLGRGNVEDNVSYPKEPPKEVSEFRIDNNYILDPQDTTNETDIRYNTIVPIYDRLVGFSYLIFNLRTQDIENRLDLKLGEIISYDDIWGNNLNAFVMSTTLKYIGGDATDENNYELTLSAEKINESSSELKYSSNIPNDILEVNRKADKNNGLIQDLVKKTNNQGTKITEISQSVDKINQSVSETNKSIKTIEEILEHFSVDLDIYNITISTNQDRYPLEDKDYYVNYSCLFEGTEVNVTPVIDNNNPGINAVIESGKLKISVYSTKVIESLNNEITLTFIYKNNDDTYALNKKININLALQGAQGEQGEKGETGATGEQGIQGEPGKDAEQPLSVKSASGKEITIEDGKYLKGLSIDGNSYQETRDGYNKLNIPNFVVDSEKGVITTGQDGIISQTGSASEFITVNIVRGAEQPILPAGTYTIYLGDRQADAYYYTYDENGEQLERKYFYYGKKSLVLTIDTSFKIDLITIYCTKELEYPELVYPMLLSGKYTDNTLPNFEKFGASPSPDFPSEIETLEYKNYLNVPSKLEVNVYKTLTDITIPAGNYILKASKITSTASTFTSLIFFYKNDTLIFQTYIGGTQSITQNVVLSSDINKIMIYSGSSYNDSVNTTTTFKELMIAKTSFPYIPFNNNAVAVKINSKNLVKPAKIDTLGYGGITCKTNEDGSFTFSGTATQNVGINLADLTSSPIILKDGKTYTQKLFLMSGDGNFSVVPYVDDIEGNRTYNYFSSTIKAPTQSKVTQGEKIVKGYNIYIGAGSSANVTFKIQLEESAEATEFEPYKEPITITLDLQGNFVGKVDDIKDRLYIENEHLYLEKKIGKVDLSELTWTNTMTNFWVSKSLSNSNIKYASSNEIVGNGLAKKYKMSMGSGMSGSDRLNCIAIDTSQISVNTDKIEITGMFYYELAEPYIVDLGKITIPLHEGYNHIELLSNLETEMSLEYQTLFAGDKAIPHIKYSQDGETFTAADDEYDWGEKPSAYYGIYYDYKLEDSTNFEDYKWYKFTEDIDKDLIEMQNKINNNSTSINNNYQELNDKLNDKASVENVVEVSKKVETLQTSTTYTINVLEDIQVNGVTKVDTGTGFTFDKNGMKVDKTGAPTGGRFDEAGVEIVDKLTAALNTLFYSGYVDEEMATKVAALTKYLGQTVTYSNSLIFQKYLSSGNARFEDIQHDIFGKGIGIFTIGGDE